MTMCRDALTPTLSRNAGEGEPTAERSVGEGI